MLNKCRSLETGYFLPNLFLRLGNRLGNIGSKWPFSAQPLPNLPNLPTQVGQRFYSVKRAFAQPAQPAHYAGQIHKYVDFLVISARFHNIFPTQYKNGGQVGQVGQSVNVKE